ncbi:MAG: glycerophosphodiester phosphodiesterase family protein [Promethearchaeota archaeon]
MLYLLISEAGDELGIIRSELEYLSPIIFLFFLFIIVLFSQKMISYILQFWKQYKQKKQLKSDKSKLNLTLIGILVVILLGMVLPYLIVPINVYHEKIPPKPKIMGHRGASHLAPENTLVAGKIAAEMGAIGWEVDVSISYDGIFFLMHDNLLKRTTNVEEIFPERINDDATMFNISELQQLDAGSWFADDDPYNTISNGYVDSQKAEEYRGEKIPTLDEVLNLTRDYNLYIDIDSGGPPVNHPYYDVYDEMLINKLYESGLNKKIMTRLSSSLTENMAKVSSTQDLDNFLESGSDVLNTIHTLPNNKFQDYQKANITVMAWTVDNIQRFSQLWMLGVDYIKTNSLHIIIPLENPVWSMHSLNYYMIWMILNLVCLGGAILVYYYRKK